MKDLWLKDFWLGGAKGGSTSQGSRLPQDDPDGIVGQFDALGQPINTGAYSLNKIEILDLLCEGPIEGVVSGKYLLTGAVGDIGYTGVTFMPYDNPGTTNAPWLRSVYWNEVPVVDSNAKFNFSTVDLSYTIGNANGSYVGSKDNNLTISRPIGERLRGAYVNEFGNLIGNNEDYAKIYRILNSNCRGVQVNIKFGQLYSRNITAEQYGDTEITQVEYQIEYKPIFSDTREAGWSVPVKETVKGKLSYGFLKSTEVLFTDSGNFSSDSKFLGWEIRITRLTPDSTTSTIVNQSLIDSITEIYNDKFVYPNCAIVRSKFDAEYFAQIPNRAYDVKLTKVKIPNNYDPILKKYTSNWDGTFSTTLQWTDNPAWCFYDLLSNTRYGLGRYLNEDIIDKWTLYQIGQYCDQLVDDGFGSYEPRFTSNIYINSREEAIKVLNDFASIFRGLVYYAGGTLKVTQDAYKNITGQAFIQFTNANLEDVNYNTSPRNTRSTVAIVRYNDRNNFYKPAVEYIQDQDAIRRYGIRENDLTAFGCTSRGQAVRMARWALYTENNESESITFTSGPECALLRPGDVVKVYDNYRNLNRLGGRVNQFLDGTTGKQIELDSNISGMIATGFMTGNFYNLTITTPTYNYDPYLVSLTSSAQVTGISNPQLQVRTFIGRSGAFTNGSGLSRIYLTDAFDFTNYTKIANPVWTVDLVSGSGLNYSSPEYWRVINVEESEANKYKVFGLKYNTGKYDYIDGALRLSPNNPEIQPPTAFTCCPSNMTLVAQPVGDYIRNTIELNYSFMVNNEAGVQNYIVFMKEDTDFTAADHFDIFANVGKYADRLLARGTFFGTFLASSLKNYFFRIYAQNADGKLSTCYAWANFVSNTTQEFRDIVIHNLSALRKSGSEPLDDTANVYTPAKITQIYSDSSPPFFWQAGFPNAQTYPNQILYRITVRPTGSSYTPSPYYYYQETGLTSDVVDGASEYEYGFDFSINKSINPDLALGLPRGPYRNYDFVVEAHDIYGNSSAGGNLGNLNSVGLPDASYINAFGYDIVTVLNSPITGASWSGDFGNFTGKVALEFGSEQLKHPIVTLSSTLPYEDLAGILLFWNPGNYALTQSFTTGSVYSGALGTSPLDMHVQQMPANFSPSVMTDYPITIYGSDEIPAVVKSGYFAFYPYDIFDDELIVNLPNRSLNTFLTGFFDYRLMSNVISGFMLPIGTQTSVTSVARPIVYAASAIEVHGGSGQSVYIPSYPLGAISGGFAVSSSEGITVFRSFDLLRSGVNYFDTKLIYVATGVNDPLGGLFQYFTGITNIDDGVDYLMPTGFATGSTGRYVRMTW